MREIRVPKARFKYNMNPFVQQAKHGATVIVTNGGKDEFEVVPCVPHGAPPTMPSAVDPKDYEGIDMNEPAFPSWEECRLKVLLDSGVWWYRTLELPLKKPLYDFLKHDVTEWWLSPLSVSEMLYKVTHKKLSPPQSLDWPQEMIRGYHIAPLTIEAGRVAGQWKWRHGDPIDRLLAATALTEGLTLIHTDKVLKSLPGFPQVYFPA